MTHKRSVKAKIGYLMVISSACSTAVFAAPPNAGTLLDTVKPLPVVPESPGTLVTAPEELRPAMRNNGGLHFTLKDIRFTGNKVFTDKVLRSLVIDQLGKETGFAELEHLTGLITKYYRDHGYMVARAYVPEQQIKDGLIEIAILEGRLGDVKVNYHSPGPKIPDSLLKGMITGAVAQGDAINVNKLERGMLLENELPNMKASSVLVPGASVGTSDLVLEANQQGWFHNDTLEVDNAGSRYSGTTRYGGSANLASPFGLGDQLTGRILTSLDGFDYGRLSWSMPVGTHGLKAGVAETYSDYSLNGPYSELGMRGLASISSAFLVYPYIRSRFLDLYQTATVEHKNLVSNSNDGVLSHNTINDVQIGLNGDETDSWLGGGLSSFTATYTYGRLDLSDDPTNQVNDASTAQTQGNYGKFQIQAMRQQQLGKSWVLYGSLTGQLSNKNLDSSESLSFGGPAGVRSYPVGEAPADEGLLATLELRYNSQAPKDLGSLQYVLFYDHGNVQLHHNTWAAFNQANIHNVYTLEAVGIGANLYKENNYLISVTGAWKIGSNPNPGTDGTDADGRKEDFRFWVQLIKYL